MGDPWRSATEGFNKGVNLGVRSYERAEDKKEKEKDRTATSEYRKKSLDMQQQGLDISKAKEARSAEEFDVKKAVRKAKTTLNVAKAQIANDNKFEAANTISKYYNEQAPNGDEVRIFQREFSGDNPAFAEVPPDHNVVVQSKTGGIKTFKNLDAVVEMAAGMANVESISSAYQASRQALAKKNADAALAPFTAEDGKKYIQTFKMGPGGIPVPDQQIPFVGKPKASATQVKLGRRLTDQEKRIDAGLREKEKQPKVMTSKETAEAENKQLTSAKKKLDLALRPFVSRGKSTYNWQTGEETIEGKNAIEGAQKLIEKSKTGKLTDTEKANLPKARNALRLYDEISEKVAPSEKPPVKGAIQAKDGMWYTPDPNRPGHYILHRVKRK